MFVFTNFPSDLRHLCPMSQLADRRYTTRLVMLEGLRQG